MIIIVILFPVVLDTVVQLLYRIVEKVMFVEFLRIFCISVTKTNLIWWLSIYCNMWNVMHTLKCKDAFDSSFHNVQTYFPGIHNPHLAYSLLCNGVVSLPGIAKGIAHLLKARANCVSPQERHLQVIIAVLWVTQPFLNPLCCLPRAHSQKTYPVLKPCLWIHQCQK